MLKEYQTGVYAFVEVSANASNDAAGTALAIFDEDNYSDSSPFNSFSDEGVVFNSGDGTFTFADAGAYYITLTAAIGIGSVDTSTSAYFLLHDGDSNELYEMNAYVWKNTDPVERSIQIILEVASGSVIVPKFLSQGGRTVTMRAGTTISFQKIKSDIYAAAEVTSNDGSANADAFHPFDGDESTMSRTVAKGITQQVASGQDGKHIIVTAGRYMVGLTNVFASSTAGYTTVEIRVLKNGNVYYKYDVHRRAVTDPVERSVNLIMDLAVDDYIQVTWDDQDSTGITQYRGTAICLFKLDENLCEGSQDSYFSTHISESESNGKTAEFNPFQSSSYADNGYQVGTTVDSGITHSSTDGTFTFAKPGLYATFFTGKVGINTGATVTISFKKNSKTIYSAAEYVDPNVDPVDRSLAALLKLDKGDVMTTTLTPSANTLTCSGSTSISFYRVHPFHTPTAKAKGLFEDDYTVNTFAQNNLSVQYQRNSPQVPFKLGARGPISLRGRGCDITHTPDHVSAGEKKN